MSTHPDQSAVVVDTVLDDAPFARITLLVTVLCSLALILDGFDILAISFAAPCSAWRSGP